tara:strand:- start:24613 stop:25578 length:966 start_codon:yes stop_codon:yes gene_type:complete
MYKVLIVGCGKIAGSLDYESDKNEPYTHAKAYKQNKNYKLVACIDPDEEKRRYFKDFWGFEEGFSSINEAILSGINFDIISICSPTESHLDCLEQCIDLRPTLVFCEKPLCTSSKKAEIILDKYHENNIKILLNFSRRFDKSIRGLKKDIDNRKYGELRAVSGIYNKGLINNGSHLIDCLLFLFDDIKIEWVGRPKTDYHRDDPSLPLTLSCKKNVPISILNADSNDYSIFELDLIFSKKRIRITEGGMNWLFQDVRDDKNFSGYKTLGKPYERTGGYKDVFTNSLELIDDIIRGKKKNLFSKKIILKTIIILEKISQKLK